MEPALARRLVDAFARGSGHGLLQLGTSEIGVALPPVLSYWREFGIRYVTDLCTLPDVAIDPTKAHVPSPPMGELQPLALASPPMTGAEYLTPEVLQGLWQQMNGALTEELSQSGMSIQDFLKHRNPAWNLVGRVHFNLAENRKDDRVLSRFSPPTPAGFLRIPRLSTFRWARLCWNTPGLRTVTACCRCCFPFNERPRSARG